MNKKEFKQFILSIGFKYNGHGYYVYKEYKIDLYKYNYSLHNGSEWVYDIDLNHLSPFKKFTRSIKLKELLR